MFTRDDYMNRKCTHREFYAQFVTDSIIDSVRRVVGYVEIKTSTDEHFNDIPIRIWDSMQPWLLPRIHAVQRQMGYNGGASLSDCVCVAKEAAKQIKERE